MGVSLSVRERARRSTDSHVEITTTETVSGIGLSECRRYIPSGHGHVGLSVIYVLQESGGRRSLDLHPGKQQDRDCAEQRDMNRVGSVYPSPDSGPCMYNHFKHINHEQIEAIEAIEECDIGGSRSERERVCYRSLCISGCDMESCSVCGWHALLGDCFSVKCRR